jgi:hypothetical protein
MGRGQQHSHRQALAKAWITSAAATAAELASASAEPSKKAVCD